MSDQVDFTIAYKDAPGKVTLPVSGVWGGPNYQGQLVANVYVERVVYPEGVKIRISQDKAEEQPRAVDNTMVREVLASLVLDPEIAIILGRWLVTQGEALQVQLERPVKLKPLEKAK